MDFSVKKAQVSIETLLILGVSLILILSFVSLVYDQASGFFAQEQTKIGSAALRTLVQEINDAYFLGPGTTRSATIRLPELVDFSKSFISGRSLVLNVAGSDLVATASVDVVGVWPNSSGTHVFTITTYDGFVAVSAQKVGFNPPGISEQLIQGTSKDVNLVVTNTDSTNLDYAMTIDFPSDGSSGATITSSLSNPLTFPAVSNYDIPLTVSCSNTSFGSYSGEIVFVSTIGDNNLSVPANVVCASAQSKLSIFPRIVNESVSSSSTYTKSFSVCNSTNTTFSNLSSLLSGEISSIGSVSVGSVVPANSCIGLDLSVPPQAVGSYTGRITVSSSGLSAYSDVNIIRINPSAITLDFTSPSAGTYSGYIPIYFALSGVTESTADLNARFYYSASKGAKTNYIGDSNLFANCFTGGDYSDRNCSYTWRIDNNNLTGSYYIDVELFDGESTVVDSSSSALTINRCSNPYDGLTITVDTNLCYNTFDLNDPGGNGVIIFGGSGVDSNLLTLDCSGATIRGTTGYGVLATNRSYIELKNCNILDYPTSAYFGRTSGTVSGIYLSDLNLSSTGIISGTGIQFYGTMGSASVTNVVSTSRQYGLYFSHTGISIFSDFNILNSSFSGGVDGVRSSYTNASGYSSARGFRIMDSNFRDNNTWGLVFYDFNKGVVSNVDASESANGLYMYGVTAGAYSSVSVSDVNVSKSGTKSGTAIRFLINDSNFLRVNGNNREYGIFNNGATLRNRIFDSNFDGCSTGLYYGGSAAYTLTDWNVGGSNFRNASGWGVNASYSTRLSFSSDNNVDGSANGLAFYDYSSISGLSVNNVAGTGIYLRTGNSLTDVNVSYNGSRGGTGVQVNGNDNNFLRVSGNNKQYGLFLGAASSRVRVIDSNFNGCQNGFHYNSLVPTDWNFTGGSMQNSTGWALYAISSVRLIFDNVNVEGSAHGIRVGTYSQIRNIIMDNVATTTDAYTIYLAGNNSLTDVNVSRNGTRIGYGIYINGSDNNLLRVSANNRNHGLYSYGANSRVRVMDSSFDGCAAGFTNGNSTITDWNISNTSFRRSAGWAFNASGASTRLIFSNDNNIDDSGYGLNIGSYTSISNWAMNNITNEGIRLVGFNSLTDVDVSKSGTKVGIGINVSGGDNNFIRINANNRVTGVYGTGDTYRNRIVSSSLDGCTTGIRTVNTIYDWNISDCSIQNATSWAINPDGSIRLKFSNDNNVDGSANGVRFFDYTSISDWVVNNVAGTAISFRNYNSLTDVNVSKSGTKAGNGVEILGSDNNLLRVVSTNRTNGIYGVNNTYRNKIFDSNMDGCTTGIRTVNTIFDWNVYNCSIQNASSWGVYPDNSTRLSLINCNLFGSANGAILQTSGYAVDINASKSGTKSGDGIRLVGNDNSLLRVDSSNRTNGIYGSNNTYRNKIVDSNLNGNTYGVRTIHTIYDWNIQSNNFQSSSTYAIYADNSSGAKLKRNNFINNATNIRLTATDANFNYWSNHPCTDTTPDDGVCDNAYTFTTGSDGTPSESPIP